MARFLRSKAARIGHAPGALVYLGERRSAPPVITVTTYGPDACQESDVSSLDQLELTPGSVTWVNLCGLEDTVVLDGFRQRFTLHPLVIEDILDTDSRPTLADFGDYVFITVRMLRFDPGDSATVISEEVSMVIGDRLLLTFQESPGDTFDPVRERMRAGHGRVRHAGADYLAYRLLDTVVDHYMDVIERLGEQVEDVDEAVLDEEPAALERISIYKREMNFLRKAVRPSREAMMQLAKLDSELIGDTTVPFLRDLDALVTHAAESIETYRDMLSDAQNTYRSAVTGRLNEVMKILTIFTALFIPLTFIVGVYGMNFDHLPELHYRNAYFMLWGVMLVVVAGLLWFFRRKEWF